MDPIEAHFGPGPLTATLLAWKRGEIGGAVACDRLKQPAVCAAVDVDAFARLSDLTVRWGYHGHWQEALTLHQWLAEMLMAAPERYSEYLVHFTLEHLRVVTLALWHRPDAALYRRTVAIAEGLVGQPGLSPSARSKLAHELGILHLDPWAANRGSLTETEQWVRQATAPDGADGAVLPGGAEAMDRAEHWLRQALKDARGIDRLESLKALLQCLFGREAFGGRVNERAARPLLDEALALLPQFPRRGDIAAYLQMVAARLGAAPPAPATQVSADSDWEARVEQTGIEVVFATLFTALRAATLEADRDGGLRLARRVMPLIDAQASEVNRLSFHEEVMRLMAGDASAQLPDQTQTLESLGELARCEPSSPRGQHLVAQVLSWILGFVGQDREADARVLLNALGKVAPALWDDWGTALNLLAAQLDVGTAVNELNAGRIDKAVRQCHSAWTIFAALRFDRKAVDMLNRVADLLPRGSAHSAQLVCELVREQPGPQDAQVIEVWQQACTELAGAATHALEPGAGAWYAAARPAKGPSYGTLLARPQAYDWRTDPVAAATLQEIRAQENALDADERRAVCLEYSELFEEVLVSYRSVPLETAGATPAERRENLARRLDLHVRQRLEALGGALVERFTLADAAALLPDDAVVLDLFLPRGGAAMGYCLGFTATEQRLLGIRSDEDGIRGVALGGTVAEHEMTTSAFLVADLRKHLQDESERGAPASAPALQALRDHGRRFLGHALEWLQELHAAGMRHLIVVPSGPLHFYPLHLLGLDGRTLADDWIVTYLPSLDLLRKERPARGARQGAGVFALGYERVGAPALRPLPGAVAEGRAVAQVLGVPLRPEADATPSQVAEALVRAGIVHVACHGEHDVVAPSLQCLRLVPETGSDGRFSALDLLGLDLRGLSVLGLSACETALGRFDLGDNLLGLTANALARGAEGVGGLLRRAVRCARRRGLAPRRLPRRATRDAAPIRRVPGLGRVLPQWSLVTIEAARKQVSSMTSGRAHWSHPTSSTSTTKAIRKTGTSKLKAKLHLSGSCGFSALPCDFSRCQNGKRGSPAEDRPPIGQFGHFFPPPGSGRSGSQGKRRSNHSGW